MPFDLYLSRARSMAQVRGEPESRPDDSFINRIIARASASMMTAVPAPILEDDFHAVMAGAPATRKGEHTYWVRYPGDEGDPWFLSEWRTAGHVLLSTSYSNHCFLRNFPDMFEVALKLATELGARVFEDVRGQEVTKENVDALLAPEGSYAALQVKTFQNVVDSLDRNGQAALEYPLGGVDGVTEFLVLCAKPSASNTITRDAAAALLAERLSGVTVEPKGADALGLLRTSDNKWLAKVQLRADGIWQVWPAHGEAPFSDIAPVVVGAAEAIQAATNGTLDLCGRYYDDATKARVHELMNGLAVDFFVWNEDVVSSR